MTAGVYRQCEVMRDYLMPALPLLNQICPGWKLLEQSLETPDGNKFLWYSADNPGFFEGQHAENLGLFIDESKSVKDEMAKNGIVRLQPKRILAMSSPGPQIGWFYDTFASDREFWDSKSISAFDCRDELHPWAEEVKEQYGEKSAYYKSAVLGEFTEAGENTLIPLFQVQSCVENPPHHTHSGQFVAGIDLSAGKKGGDECVLMYRLGNKVFDPVIFMGFTDEMAVVGEVVRALKRLKIGHVFADAGGIGGPMIARLAEILMGKEIVLHRVHFGSTHTTAKALFHDKAMEIWQNMADLIESRRIILPKDDKLIGQLATREYKPMSSGRKLIPKSEQKEKYGKSPDRADALALCLMEPPYQQSKPTGSQKPDKQFGSQTIDTFPTAAWEQEDQSKRSSVGFELGG